MAHKSDNEIIAKTHNTARFFVENRHISWVVLALTVVWGIYGYFAMPQRKDPDIPVRIAAVLVPWPGKSAEKVEELVTRRVESVIAGNSKIKKIESISRTGLSVLYVELEEKTKDTGKQFDDIKMRLDGIKDLPENAGPINFIKDFGDTAALMLTVASPKVDGVELDLRVRDERAAIDRARAEKTQWVGSGRPFTLLYNFPRTIVIDPVHRHVNGFIRLLEAEGIASHATVVAGSGFAGVDGVTNADDTTLLSALRRYLTSTMRDSDLHPDAWGPALIHDPSETEAKLSAIAGDKYTYRELNDYTEQIQKYLQRVDQVAKVERSGVLSEQVFLVYSQERLASYGMQQTSLKDRISARNITLPAGQVTVSGRDVAIDATGEFQSEKELADLLIASSPSGSPVYLRDVAEVMRGYENPARYLNYYTWKDKRGEWHRTRAITLSVQMRAGEKIHEFGKAVDGALENVRHTLPEDLMMARTSDQPLQVEENIHLFMNSLYEAVILVVLISWLGFWEWRSALLMALSIPLTLAMTFGAMYAIGMDLQQVSIATLIIALGLLVDDPVVAGDAIKRDLALGHPPLVSAWLGPTKLAKAIMYATVTNIVAYVPLLMITGDLGRFLVSLPIVITCSLVASRLVSMTFIPLFGYYLLRPKAELTIEERRQKGFAAFYYRVGGWAIEHRWKVLAGSFGFLFLGGLIGSQLKAQFMPKDLSYLAYVDVWLPTDSPLVETNGIARRTEDVVREVAAEFGQKHDPKRPHDVLQSLTTFVGGGGPRFWFSVSPEMQQVNYAQIVIQTRDKHDTQPLISELQKAISARIPGAQIDVRQLDTASVGIPVSIRISGDDIATLKAKAEELKAVLRSIPTADRVRDDWANDTFSVSIETTNDRANLSGVTNLDVAASALTATIGSQVGTLREGNKQIPVTALMRSEERAQLSDIQNLYVFSQNAAMVPLRSVASVDYSSRPGKLRRRHQFRTITVSAFPAEGSLSSEVLAAAMPGIEKVEKSLPVGYQLEIGGEYHEQQKGFKELAVVMATSILCIFMALVLQFKHAVKPLIVFAAIPYGVVGALFALWVTGMPFGFMAFLGIASLMGVIVSHVIVLFDFIEEAHERGESLKESLLDAGIMRLRPVMITVGATVIALFPLAAHGGPLWEPLCFTQIGGLTIATFITLLLVPVIYAIFVLDLKWVKWQAIEVVKKEQRLEVKVAAAMSQTA
jgi:multidrug efflux pump subunit AcrB